MVRSYQQLVKQRKQCSLCLELTNPSTGECARFDSNEIGPWTKWQGSLNADLMVVGQDWGDVAYFISHQGSDQPTGNPTNENLRELLSSIGFSAGTPGNPTSNAKLFFTNLVLCLKQGGLQAAVKQSWFENCGHQFFEPLLQLIKPKAVIALGNHPATAIPRLAGLAAEAKLPLSKKVEASPFHLTSSDSALFPVFHCGAWGVNRNRKLELQLQDWQKIKQWLTANS